MRRVTGLNLAFSSPSVSSSFWLTSPSTTIFQASGSFAGIRNHAVVADEELVGRRGVVVEQVLGRLGHQRTLAEHDQLVALAREIQVLRAFRRAARLALRHRRRDQAARHVRAERYAATHGRAHGGEPGAAEEAAAVDAGSAAERDGVGAFGIIAIKLFDRALDLAGH